jgi:oxaloacetate decarboxylase gamma subunit
MLECLNLMGLGMGFVFLFLTVLVLTTKAMSALILKYFPTTVSAISKPADDLTPAQLAASDTRLIAILMAAVHRFRQEHKH